ncbi:MAG: hypothetical protein HPY44_00940 [Armatimonadetes bacterium]|nr:hypothetical protein [Armatimonadota bacterium]
MRALANLRGTAGISPVGLVSADDGPADVPRVREGTDFASQAALERVLGPRAVRALSCLAVRLVALGRCDQRLVDAAGMRPGIEALEMWPWWRVELWPASGDGKGLT